MSKSAKSLSVPSAFRYRVSMASQTASYNGYVWVLYLKRDSAKYQTIDYVNTKATFLSLVTVLVLIKRMDIR